jgi:hypothetical protein
MLLNLRVYVQKVQISTELIVAGDDLYVQQLT